MDEENKKIHISDTGRLGDFELEAILAEYRQARDEAEVQPRESLADRSKRLVFETLDDSVDAAGFEVLGGLIDDTVAQQTPEAAPQALPEEAPAAEAAEDYGFEQTPAEEEEPLLTPEQEAMIAELAAQQEQPEGPAAVEITEDGDMEYADAGAGQTPVEDDEEDAPPRKKRDTRSAREKFMQPLVAVMALITLRRNGKETARAAQEAQDARETARQPEPTPEKAVREQAGAMGSLRLRGRIAVGLCLVLVYLSFAYGSVLPLTGALKSSPRVLALMLLILEGSVMMACLDVFTRGVMALVRGKPDGESLAAVSCILTAADAIALAVRNPAGPDLPFCAVSALSLTCALWGSYFRSSALRTGFRVLTSSKNLYTVTGEAGITADSVALLKSRRSTAGFIRRSQEPDYGKTVFRIAAPILLAAALVLGALPGIVHKAPKEILHHVAILAAAAAAFSSTLSFSLPFAVAARRFAQSGSAVAGWPGIRDIGRSRHVVITDTDVFPKGMVTLGDIRVLETVAVDKVIAYTGSVMAASGSGLAAPFADLIRRNGYTLYKVENFEPHDGGGMTAMVNGENVCVGNVGFMNLMGIRVPRKLSVANGIYAAVNGALMGIFTVEYKATGGVQDALVLLLHSSLEPVFAIRDFNITPQMLKTKFKMPTDSFKFPAYAERYRISGAEPDEESRVAAAIAREGMGPLVDAADRGRRLYTAIRAGALIAVLGCVFGLLTMFLMCWTQALAPDTASSVVIFMLLWLIPTAVITWSVAR